MYPHPITHIEPERYVICARCKTILGYTAQVGEMTFLFLYSYPPRGVRPNLADRRIAGRMLSGDVLCPYCGAWQNWTSTPATATNQ